MEQVFLITSSYLTDLLFGDPEWFPHPVRITGKFINLLENFLRGNRSKTGEKIKGAILVVLVLIFSGGTTYLILEISRQVNKYLWYFIWIFIGWTTIAVKDLHIKSTAILDRLEEGNLEEARKELSKIVGRDTEKLTEDKIIKATVESIAENTSDGIVAPLFYLILGGPVLAMIYKAINTLDSMVGYRNEKYINFGWASAKLDDIANFIPARITGFLISLSSLILGYGFLNSFKIMIRDGKLHPSPNSGIPEAAISGALQIRLGGPSSYQGKEFKKPYIGEDKREISPSIIREALNISFLSSILMFFAGVFFKWKI